MPLHSFGCLNSRRTRVRFNHSTPPAALIGPNAGPEAGPEAGRPELPESLLAQTARAVAPGNPDAADPQEIAARRAAAVDLLRGVGPGDDVESMLAAQMVGAHSAAMECLARAASPERSGARAEAARARDLRLAAKLLAIYSWQVRTLDVWQHRHANMPGHGSTAGPHAGTMERVLVRWLD
ncbi:MAG: hypothetical protein VW709_19435, partial [Rickettsiales bacterium]